MNRRGFDFEKKAPLYRSPKYSGITLTLLSIFVLLCMVIVWEKIPQVEEPISLKGIASLRCKEPLTVASLAFQKETGIIIDIEYMEDTDLQSVLKLEGMEKNNTWDFAVCPEKLLFQDSPLREFWSEQIPIAYFPPVTNGSFSKEIALVGWIAKNTTFSNQSLLFCRFLSAPSRGQFYFAESGFSGVRGDRWSFKPSLNLLATPAYKSLLRSSIDHFQKREGVSIHAQFLPEEELLQVLLLTSKSKGKQYLPDLALAPLSFLSPHLERLPFDPLSEDSQNLSPTTLLSKWSTLPNTAKRFFHCFHESLLSSQETYETSTGIR